MSEPLPTKAPFRDSEERYRVLFEMESDAIFLIDNEAGQILEVNPAASALYGYTREELLAKRNVDLSAEPEDTRAATQEQRARVPVRYHRKQDGTVFPVEITARHFLWRGREAHIAAIRDITERQRAADALAHRTRQLEAVRAVTAEIIRELELPTVLRLITERACVLTGATAGDLDLWDDARQLLVPGVTYGHAAARPAAPRRLGEGAMGTVAQRRQGLIINDYRTSGLAHPLTLAQTRITASLLEPLLYGDRLLGVLGVDHEQVGRTFSAQDQAALQLFAAEAAIAIENARLFHAELSRRTELEAVQAVNEELARELDLATLLRLIHARALELVGGDSGVVWLWDAAAQVLIPQHWTGFGPWMADARILAGEGVVGAVVARRDGLLVNEFRTSPYATPFWLDRSPHVAVLAEPLLYGEHLVGVITVNRKDPARPFGAEQQQRLRLFAAPAAIAIQNARLYDAAQRALRQREAAEAELRKIVQAVEQSPSIVIITDTTGAIEYVNPKFTAVTGYALAEVRGQNPRLLKSGHTSAAEYAALWATLTAGREWRGEFRNRRKDGTLYWEAASISPVRAPDGVPTHYVAVKEDITARKAAEEALQRSASQLEALRATTADITRELDPAKVLTLVIHRAAGLLQGISGTVYLVDPATGDIAPQAWVGHGDWLAALRLRPGEGLAGTIVQRGQGRIENTYRTSPYAIPLVLERTNHAATLGEPLMCRDRVIGAILVDRAAEPFAEQDQALLRLFADEAAIAIEHARLYEAVRTHAAALEARVRDRTADLERANAQLRKASQVKSEFLATMSHEIRTPLNSILGFAQLLREQTTDRLAPKQARFLTHILQSGQHLLQLISDILDLAKVEAGKVTLETAPLDVRQTLDGILVVARGLAHKKGQQIDVQIAPRLPPLRADSFRFKQICFNLLSNAVKYTPEGGRITLAAQASPEGTHLDLRVSDTGAGIRAEDLPRLFREFVQLDTTDAARQEGTGLGLALSKQLVELHGGTIAAASAGAGQGSTFIVRLPFAGPAPRLASGGE